jgi:hypothetical protein
VKIQALTLTPTVVTLLKKQRHLNLVAVLLLNLVAVFRRNLVAVFRRNLVAVLHRNHLVVGLLLRKSLPAQLAASLNTAIQSSMPRTVLPIFNSFI